MLGGIYIFTPLKTMDGQKHPMRLSANPDGTHMLGGTSYTDANTIHMGTGKFDIFLFLLLPSNLFHWLCHVSPLILKHPNKSFLTQQIFELFTTHYLHYYKIYFFILTSTFKKT